MGERELDLQERQDGADDLAVDEVHEVDQRQEQQHLELSPVESAEHPHLDPTGLQYSTRSRRVGRRWIGADATNARPAPRSRRDAGNTDAEERKGQLLRLPARSAPR